MGIVISGDFEQFGWIGEAMDFIQHDTMTTQAVKEGLRVFHHSPSAWELTVEVFNVGETLAEEGLPNTADSCQPDHGAFTPSLFDEFLPEVSLYHMHVLLHKVLLNDNLTAFGADSRFPPEKLLGIFGASSTRESD